MYLEHKPLHTSRSGDTILPLLGHTLGLKKIFFLVLLFFYDTPIPFPPNATAKVKPGAQSSGILSVLLKPQANICALLTGNVTFSLKVPVAQRCFPLCCLAPQGMAGHWRGQHLPQMDASTGCAASPLAGCEYLGEFLNPHSKSPKPLWTDNSDTRLLP